MTLRRVTGEPRRAPRRWPLPTIIVSLVLVVTGIVYAWRQTAATDIDRSLSKARLLLDHGDLTNARITIAQGVEPGLPQAKALQQGRYHVLMAQMAQGHDVAIVEHLAEARRLGHALSISEQEQWAHALLNTGDLETLRSVLAALVAIQSGDQPAQHVLERLFSAAITQAEPPFQILHEVLDDQPQNAWAAAQRARILLAAGHTEQAVQHLTADITRLEAGDNEDGLADLYLRLGQACYQMGRLDEAQASLHGALARFRGHAQGLVVGRLLMGQIALDQRDPETALENFDTIVRASPPRQLLLQALLGRAQAYAGLGDHVSAAADDEWLLEAATRQPLGKELQTDFARSLLLRHDAALAAGDVERTLPLGQRVQRLYARAGMPADVIGHLAHSRRTIADLESDRQLHLQAAGDLFLEHARLLRPMPESDRTWADSLWQAGDCYDLGGNVVIAIEVFREYVAGCGDDLRRAEALFRLAQCNRSIERHEAALQVLVRLIDEHPHSPYATRAHVALARCYRQLERHGESIQHLESVLRGQQALMPDAVDYRDALIELGVVHHEVGDQLQAIGRLKEAVDRYPNDPRRDEILFRLADSHRRRAVELGQQLDGPSPLASADRARKQKHRAEHLSEAATMFAQLVQRFDEPERTLDTSERQMRRLSQLYRADSAFDLEAYEEAAERYQTVAREYVDHHCSMFALVQIINCHHHLGNRHAAAVAHERALARLGQLSPDVFDAPEVLLGREAWRRWLQNSLPSSSTMHAAASG
jgi:tetratricopeptide (TPR) repeat protein